VNIEQTRGQPGVKREARLVPAGDIEEDHERQQPRHDNGWNGDEMGLILDPMSENPENQERREGKQWDQCVRHRRSIVTGHWVTEKKRARAIFPHQRLLTNDH
jgi:hypothetical protein